jgi:hypothetical protein
MDRMLVLTLLGAMNKLPLLPLSLPLANTLPGLMLTMVPLTLSGSASLDKSLVVLALLVLLTLRNLPKDDNVKMSN